MKTTLNIAHILFLLMSSISFLAAQETEDLLVKARAQYEQGQFVESEKSFNAFFEKNQPPLCNQKILTDLDKWAMSSLFNRSDQLLERLEQVEQCVLSLGLENRWAQYLIEHSEALRIVGMAKAGRPKLFQALKYPKLSASDKAQAYALLAYSYVREKGDSTVLFANHALEVALEIQDTVALLESFQALSIHTRSIGKLHEAIDWNRRALNYQKGKHHFKKSETFINLTNLFLTLKDYEKAEKYTDSTYLVVDTSLYIQFSAKVDKLYGDILSKTDRLEAANQKYLSALGKTKRINLKFDCLIALAELQEKAGHQKLADQYLNDAFAIGKDSDDLSIKKQLALIQAKKALTQNNYQAVITQAKKGLLLQQNNNSQIYTPDFYWHLAKAYENINQSKLSLDNYKKYYAGKDSLEALINQELIYTLENEYTAAEQDKALFNLNTQNTLQQLRLKQQRWFGLGILLFLSLLAPTIFFLLRLNRKIKTQTSTIQEAVLEKNVLLKEIHHRVKNNLQVISSLFNLQSRFVSDENALNALKESHNRVNSLALLHQNLYQEENLKGIEMPSYIDQLCDALFTASSNTNHDVRYENKIAPIILDIDTVIPLGLIITELISSALKRNYESGHENVINVELQETNGNLSLTVKDNSTSTAVSITENKNTFSQKIIDAFSKKLKATLNYNRTNGVEINMLIKRYKVQH